MGGRVESAGEVMAGWVDMLLGKKRDGSEKATDGAGLSWKGSGREVF